ncbi:MAG: hypothetical protein JWO68_606, partial [Actinomycetia bacterium]|nr:hypothetical protein [Actinomycetes bacterium]
PEALGEGPDLVEHRLQPFGDHGAHGTEYPVRGSYWIDG